MAKTNRKYCFKLSNRETQVMELVAQGLSDKEITEELKITRSTLKTHLHHIYSKMVLFLDDNDGNKPLMRVRAVLTYLKEKGRLR